MDDRADRRPAGAPPAPAAPAPAAPGPALFPVPPDICPICRDPFVGALYYAPCHATHVLHLVCAVLHLNGCRVRGVPFNCPSCRVHLPDPVRPPLDPVPEGNLRFNQAIGHLDLLAQRWTATQEPLFAQIHPLPRDIVLEELKETIQIKRKHLLRERDSLVRKFNAWWTQQRKKAHDDRRAKGKLFRKLALLNLALHHQPTEAAFMGRNLDAEDAEINGDDD